MNEAGDEAVLAATVQVFTADLPASLAFYRLLGLTVPSPAPPHPEHVVVELPGGNRLSFDTDETIAAMHPGWAPGDTGARLVVALSLASPAAVDEVFGRVTAAGFGGPLAPYDAPWGERYATVADPDGSWVDLSAPLPA